MCLDYAQWTPIDQIEETVFTLKINNKMQEANNLL